MRNYYCTDAKAGRNAGNKKSATLLVLPVGLFNNVAKHGMHRSCHYFE